MNSLLEKIVNDILSNKVIPESVDYSNFIHYLTCPRYWFFKNMLGLQRVYQSPPIDLVFGSAWHAALEGIYTTLQYTDVVDDQTLYDIATFEFDKKWWEKDGESIDLEEAYPKTPTEADAALWLYIKQTLPYITTHGDVIHVEMPFSIPIAAGMSIVYGTIDLVLDDGKTTTVVEHKTTKSASLRWRESWYNSYQLEVYNAAAVTYFSPLDRETKVLISGAVFQKKTPAEKFVQIPFHKSNAAYSRFLHELTWRLLQFEKEHEKLLEDIESDLPQAAFPRNPSVCFQYRPCNYYDLCASWTKPYACDSPPSSNWQFTEEGIYTQGGNEDAKS